MAAVCRLGPFSYSPTYFLRYQTTHERAFYKALNALAKLKQSRARKQAVSKFVSHARPQSRQETGFVSQKEPPQPVVSRPLNLPIIYEKLHRPFLPNPNSHTD